MTSREQIDIELSVFENEIARISAEDLAPQERVLVNNISENLAIIQERRDDLTWLDIRAWVVSVRQALLTNHAIINIPKMLKLGMTL